MSVKYHISPTTGNPNICRAHKRPCPVGGEGDHFASKEEARKAFEKKQAAPKAMKKGLPPLTERDQELVKYLVQKTEDKARGIEEIHSVREGADGSVRLANRLAELDGNAPPVNPTGFGSGRAGLTLASRALGKNVELSPDGQGNIYMRVYEPGHAWGYGYDKSWRLPANATQALPMAEKLFTTIHQEEEEKRARLKASFEKEKREARPAHSVVEKREVKDEREASTKNFLKEHSALEKLPSGPPPKNVELVTPAQKRWRHVCSSCGGHDVEWESPEEQADNAGYSSCCNKYLDTEDYATKDVYR